jgi:hypothetical protein
MISTDVFTTVRKNVTSNSAPHVAANTLLDTKIRVNTEINPRATIVVTTRAKSSTLRGRMTKIL